MAATKEAGRAGNRCVIRVLTVSFLSDTLKNLASSREEMGERMNIEQDVINVCST